MEHYLQLYSYRIIILGLGVLLIIAFSIYTFGSYSTKPKTGTKVEPVKSAVTTNNSGADIENSNQDKKDFTKNAIGIPTKSLTLSSNPSSSSLSVPMSLFENREKIENFYSIQFPSSSTVLHGNESGSYVAKFSKGNFSVGLIDIPDNSNVQLYVLTQVKPSLKSSIKDFNLGGIKQLTLNGHRAWEIIYTWKNMTRNMESIKTFVEGMDNAATITFSWPKQQSTDQIINSTIIGPVLTSFHWTTK
jgi:hypothetical protein